MSAIKALIIMASCIAILSSIASAQRLPHNRPQSEMFNQGHASQNLIERRQHDNSIIQGIEENRRPKRNREDETDDFFQEKLNRSRELNRIDRSENPIHENNYRQKRYERDNDYLGAK